MATGKANGFITDLITLLFNNTSMANYGDAGGILHSAAAGSFYISLHTADPGAAGGQNTSEAAYTGYVRQAVARSSAGFTISGQNIVLAADVTFPIGSAGGETCTYVGVGRDSGTGAGKLLYRCTLTPNIVTGNGITPIVKAGGTGITES